MTGIHRTVAEAKTLLRRDLSAAMKARRSGEVAALRTAIAVLDNAEAVDPDPNDAATEVDRRHLTPSDVRLLLRRCVDDNLAEAQRYADLGRQDAAERLRREAEIVARYL